MTFVEADLGIRGIVRVVLTCEEAGGMQGQIRARDTNGRQCEPNITTISLHTHGTGKLDPPRYHCASRQYSLVLDYDRFIDRAFE